MIKVVGENLKQYDLGRKVEIIPFKTNAIERISFFKSHAADPLVVASKEEDGKIVADIPNVLLMTFGVLTCEVNYLTEDGHTLSEQVAFTVHKAAKPDGYVYVETETLADYATSSSAAMPAWEGGSY